MYIEAILRGSPTHTEDGRGFLYTWSCGKTTTVGRRYLVNGHTRSCGCIRAAYLKARCKLEVSYILDPDFDLMEG